MRSYLALFWRYLGRSIQVAAIAVSLATVGYVVIADYPWFDALYMTIITMGTIGFAEVHPLDHGGRIWTIAVVFVGYAVLINMTARLTSLFLSGSFTALRERTRRNHMLHDLNNHVIVVGFGRVGRSTAEATISSGRRCVVIDNVEAQREHIEEVGAIPLIADARDLDVLERAAIHRATSLVTTLADPDNVVVVTSARFARPDLRIVSRVNDVEWCGRLERAGANETVAVYSSAGRHLATSAVTPGVLGVLSANGDATTEEMVVSVNSRAIGLSLHHLMEKHPTVVILGIQRDSSIARWHEIDGPISAGDVIIARGPLDGLRALTESITPR